VRLRVKDVDFARHEICVRDGKGGKDRHVPLPARLNEALARQVERVRVMHEQDLAEGHGAVWLPNALARKYPSASRELGWQYVFPATGLSRDPRDAQWRRHHVDESSLQRAVRGARLRAGIVNACYVSHVAAFVRNASARIGARYSNDPGIART
jgi:integrase